MTSDQAEKLESGAREQIARQPLNNLAKVEVTLLEVRSSSGAADDIGDGKIVEGVQG